MADYPDINGISYDWSSITIAMLGDFALGMKSIEIPTHPRDGISHFRMGRDNVLISMMHARLFLGMLLRSPLLLWRKVRT